ncbi:MAG TPA: RDD family protein [Candidatus Polarisedimenticolia bacterium]|nr:RDD family protein [Candidatus Polarisedimenticolia bacterium]
MPATTPPLIQPVGAPAVAAPVVLYAGFWLRFVAFIIDAIVLWFAGAIVMLPFMASLGLRGVLTGRPPMMGPGDVVVLMGTFFWVIVARVALNWLYYAGFESSPWQATLGKKALGLEVTDLAAEADAGKIISSLTLLIGYIMAGFTEKKQALHDMIASCLVLRKA